MTLDDTGGRTPSARPVAAPDCEPTQPEGMRSATLSGNKPAAAERPRGPARGTGSAGTAGTRGLSLSTGTGGAGGERAGGPGPICRSPAPGTCGSGASARWHVHRRQWTRCCGTPGPGGAGTGRWCWGRAGHPTHPREARADGMGTRRDGTGRDGGSARCHLPPAARLPARRAPAPLKGALRGPAARTGATRGSAAENTGTSP